MLLSALALATIALLIVAASGTTQPSLATTATPSAAGAPVSQWGDTDCNGTIDTQDLMRVLSRAAGLQIDPACDAQPQGEADPQLAGTGVNIGVDPQVISIPTGEQRSVNIVADVTSGNVGSWLVTVQYDPAVVTPISCSGACNAAFAPGMIVIANAPFSGISGTAVLSSVTFEARGQVGRQSNVDVTTPDVTDLNGHQLLATVSDGTITVAISREDLDCRSGVTAEDALEMLYYITGLPTTGHPSGCPALGE